MRQLKIELPTLQRGVVREVKDNIGGAWEVSRELSEAKPNEEQTEIIVLTELAEWLVRMEGVQIGTGFGPNPAEVAREVLAKSGLTSLPEAVPLFVSRDIYAKGVLGGEQFVVFTLDGAAYCVPLVQFQNEVERSGRWIQARQAKRAEIDALAEELKRLPRK